jgi:rubrerythrin
MSKPVEESNVTPMSAPKESGEPRITTLADLFAVAYQIEIDAVERYTLLAEQMETHNNPDLVAVFRDLARAEGTWWRMPARWRSGARARAPRRPISARRII